MQKLLGCSMNNYRIVQTICNYNTSNTGTEPCLIIGTAAVVQTQYSQFQSIRHHLQRLTSEGNKKRNKFLSLLTGDNIMANNIYNGKFLDFIAIPQNNQNPRSLVDSSL